MKSSFPIRLLIARRRKGLRQSDLAALIGVATSTISNWETGERSPQSIELLALTSIALGVMPNYLLGLTDENGELMMDVVRKYREQLGSR